ncbi:MAG TPA: hypothetical protein PLA03_12420 [Acidobacteriota bacterium]|nr:hypothetical protein [Acidobacteriota bacterium]
MVQISTKRKKTISLLNFNLPPSALRRPMGLPTALSLQHRPEGAVVRIISGRGRQTRDREYICSELVYECFLRAGIEFKYDKRGFISPQNLWEDQRVEIVGRVV